MHRAAPDALTEDLIRLADGDRSAFDPVFEAAWPRVLTLTQRLVGDPANAEDVAQRALLAVFERASDYDPGRGRAMPWILGIATWEVRTWRTQQRRRREDPLDAEPPSPGRDAVEHAQLVALLHELLGEQRPEDVQTLLMSAGLLERPDVAPATFRKRVQRATERLRVAWRRAHG